VKNSRGYTYIVGLIGGLDRLSGMLA